MLADTTIPSTSLQLTSPLSPPSRWRSLACGVPLRGLSANPACRPLRRPRPARRPAPLDSSLPSPPELQKIHFSILPPFHMHNVHFPLIATTIASSQHSPSSNHSPYPNSPQALALSLFLFLFLVSFLLLSFSPCSSSFARAARHTNWRLFVLGVLIVFCLSCYFSNLIFCMFPTATGFSAGERHRLMLCYGASLSDYYFIQEGGTKRKKKKN